MTIASVTPSQRSRLLLPVLLMCASLTVMSGATIAPGLPGLQEHFAAQDNVAYWVRFILTVPGLAIAISAPFAGVIADRLGRRVLLMAGIAAYVVFGSAGLYLDTIPALLVSRVALGVAVACVMTCTTALLTDHYLGAERDRVMGIQSAFMGIGGIAFITLGSVLADWSWRGPFLVYLLPAVLVPLVAFYVSKPPVATQEPGAASGEFPMRHAMLMYLFGFLAMLVFYNIPAQLPFYARELGATSNATGGLAIVVGQVAAAIASLLYGRLRVRFDNWIVMAGAFGLIGIGYLGLSVATSLAAMFAWMPVIGLGLGLNFPNIMTWLMGRVPPAYRGRAAGGLSSAVFLGQFASPLLSQPIADAYDLSTAYLVAGTFCVVALTVPSLMAGLRSRRAALPR